MTKTDLVWRLKELPTAEGIASLVEMEVITKEEGRQILLTETKVDEAAKVQALEEEVKFLRKLVDTLAAKTNNYPVIWNTYHDYKPHYERWYKRYEPILMEYKETTSPYTITAGSLNTVPAVNRVGYVRTSDFTDADAKTIANARESMSLSSGINASTITTTSTSYPSKKLSDLN